MTKARDLGDNAQNTKPKVIDAKGDLIVGTAADTADRLAVGNNGDTLLADSSTSTGLRWQGTYAAGKNLVLNGNMNIAQRGTSFAAVLNTYTLDRWVGRNNTLGEMTVSQETDAPAGFKTSAKCLFTTADATPAAGDFANYQMRFEGQALQSLQKGSATAKPTTVSFWVKSNVTGTFVVGLFDGDNSRQIAATYTINASATWEKKSVTFAGDTTGVLDNDSNQSMSLVFWLGAGSDRTSGTLSTSWAASNNANQVVGQVNVAATINNYWMVTGVQWEIGSVATEFSLAAGTLQGELAAAQRYYVRWNNGTDPYNRSGQGTAGSTTQARILINQPVFMRGGGPSAVEFSNLAVFDGVTVTAVTSLTLNSANSLLSEVYANVASGLTQYRPYQLLTNNNTAGYFALTAEL